MIEPTESESLKEIDRFCDAMLSISDEIMEIKNGIYPKDNNVISNSPHTIKQLISEEWHKPYTKQKAAYPNNDYPLSKFWSPVSRINNAYGDRNLVCACSFQEEEITEEKKCA